MKKISAGLFCGIAAIIATIILYFLIIGNIFIEIICFITLLGVVLAEVITTFLLILAKGNPRKVLVAFISSAMIPVSVFLSIVYIVKFPYGYGSYVGWYVVLYLIIAIISYILLNFNAKRETNNNTLQNAKSNMLNMRKVVKSIMRDPAAKQYAKRLNEIEEKLHFSNDCVIVAQDAKIFDMLIALQSGIADPEFDCESYLNELVKLIDTRSIMASKTV